MKVQNTYTVKRRLTELGVSRSLLLQIFGIRYNGETVEGY